MKKKIILGCLSTLLILILFPVHHRHYQPANQFLPNTLVFVSGSSGWTLKNVNETGLPGIVWIQNGEIEIPGVMSFDKPDYPAKNILIFRKIIPDSILFDEQLNDKLIELTLNDIKIILDSMWNGHYVRYSGHHIENFYFINMTINCMRIINFTIKFVIEVIHLKIILVMEWVSLEFIYQRAIRYIKHTI